MPAGEQFKRFYPGLKPAEAALWRTWLQTYEGQFDSFEYNVHVGEGIQPVAAPPSPVPGLDDALRQQWIEATQKKIDALGRRGREYWIIEVKVRPGSGALGQLLQYQALLPRTRTIDGPTILAVVGQVIEPDNLIALQDQGITVWKVAPAPE